MIPSGVDRGLKWAFVASTVGWALALPLAAAAAATPHAPAGEYALAALAYAIGRLVCHQQIARSFQLWGVQLPVCARCTGIYVGAALAAAAISLAQRPLRLDRQRSLLLASAVPIALTLVFEWTTGITPSNVVRAISGLPLGAVVARVVLDS
jgi:uncharacterized membrane protein